MKALIIFSLLAFCLPAQATVEGLTFKCIERSDRWSDPKLGHLEVTVDIKKDITNRVRLGGNAERAYDTSTEIVRIVNGKRTVVKPKFSAMATTFDVILTVWAVKAQGISVTIYLDEYDSSFMEVTDALGKKQKVGLACDAP